MTHRFKLCESCGTATITNRSVCPTCGGYRFVPIPLAETKPDEIDEWDFAWLVKLEAYLFQK